MLCRLERTVFDRARIISRLYLLTVHDRPHILDKTVDDLESLRCSSPSLIVCESIQPLEDSLNLLLSESFLDKFDCVVMSDVTRQ